MGANASAMPGEPNGLMRPKLEDIPESCMALVLSYLDPPEIAKLARINRAFRAAASADFIWVPKFPSNYNFILSKLPDQGLITMDKKDIYARLCRPNSFDGGTKEFWIDKTTGGTYLSISSKAMAITGIDDRRYWNHIQTYESRWVFETSARLFGFSHVYAQICQKMNIFLLFKENLHLSEDFLHNCFTFLGVQIFKLRRLYLD
ncbi:F-box PP2-A13-like [Olea europaea subsp. europaea]|uniref:F-box PP2-A13-like n=1 Tax=Olea europaea subsp. europaea TaxID=158383 RepID=A0A8S0RUS6_OLEEU|nr:F-box PP2-A13-like [Olea europaea subsp. europaea]